MDSNYPLPLNGIRNFYWAAKLGSFKRAAESLNVSEAAVSQQIRNLESVLEVKLFQRGHQKVELTAEGVVLFPHVQSAFTSLFQGVNQIIDDPEPNRLSVTTMPSFASHWLIAKLTNFYELYPELSIAMDTSVEARDFEKDNFDLAIRYGQGIYPGLRSELLMSEPVVLVCQPSLLSGSKITRQDILNLPMIRGTFEGVNRAMQGFMEHYKFREDQLSKLLLLRDGGLGAEAARSGQGIALQRLSLVADLIDNGKLVFAEDYAFTEYSFYAVAPEHHFKKKKVQRFLSWLKEEMRSTADQISHNVAKIKNTN